MAITNWKIDVIPTAARLDRGDIDFRTGLYFMTLPIRGCSNFNAVFRLHAELLTIKPRQNGVVRARHPDFFSTLNYELDEIFK